MEPAIVLVSGAPGAGKTTLAGPLSLALGLPLSATPGEQESARATCAPMPASASLETAKR